MELRGRTILFSLCCALALGYTPAVRADLREMTACSAHFKARADWLTGLGKNDVTASMFHRYSDRLLNRVIAETPRPVDCGALVYLRGECNESHLKAARDTLATKVLTAFVEQGYGAAGLPVCMEDRVCADCITVLKRADE